MNKLANLIRINSSYTRSINIERDSEDSATAQHYIITTKAKQTIARIIESLKTKDAPRAWAAIGPYGSGKSAFGLFLSRILGKSDSVGEKRALRALKDVDQQLHSSLVRLQKDSRGFCCIALTGSPEPLAARLVRAISFSATTFFGGRPGRPPKILEEINEVIETGKYSVSKIIDLISGLQTAVVKADGRGVLLVIDELGKFLEYEARHRGATDIYLLQALAEHTLRNNEAPLVLLALLHQSIELYAQALGTQLKNEWKKVHGRFETVPFLETTEQTLLVMQAAISSALPHDLLAKVQCDARQIAVLLEKAGALPSGLSLAKAEELFVSCYPIHPVSLLILPALCQRVAQNERTLFSYLGSNEPHGFLDSISRLNAEVHENIQWVTPQEIYEYFILNQPGLMSDQGTHRKWAEVVTALERLGDASQDEVALLKTIGLLNIVGSQGGLKASDEILQCCFQTNGNPTKAIKKILQSLGEKSLIAYRRFNHEYRVWQGTDFDLDMAVREQRAQIGEVDAATVLNELKPLPALVARRHAIETGNLRYFVPVFIGFGTIENIQKPVDPTLYICLSENEEAEQAFHKTLEVLGLWHAPAVIVPSGELIKDAVSEVLALQRVQQQSSELANDPVGQRELSDRLLTALGTQRELVDQIIENPSASKWVINGLVAKVKSKRDLQERLSALLDKVYEKAPIIRNELINRNKPSSTAVAARKKLLLAMLDSPTVADLGIEKFPAEKAIYQTTLLASRIHSYGGGQWQFSIPFKAEDPLRVLPTLEAVLEELDAEGSIPKRLSDIYEKLSRPPFGIAAGVLPILLLALFQARRKELALSEGGQFVPFLTKEVLENLLKAPSSFSLQRFNSTVSQEELIGIYEKIVTGTQSREITLIDVIQPLAREMVRLPDYSKKTKRIGSDARILRELFFASKTPVDLLLVDLPKAFGFEEKTTETDSVQLQSFAQRVTEALTELRSAYHTLLSSVISELKKSFKLSEKLDIAGVREALKRLNGLDKYTIDPQCKAFIGRLVDPFGDDGQWLVGFCSFIARKPPEKWLDEDFEAAKYRLADLASRERDLRLLQFHYQDIGSTKPEEYEANLIRLVSTREGEFQKLVMVDNLERKRLRGQVESVKNTLNKLPTDEARFATLAIVLRELMPRDVSASPQIENVTGFETNKGVA